VSTVGLFANKYIVLNHEWNFTGNYAVGMHKRADMQSINQHEEMV